MLQLTQPVSGGQLQATGHCNTARISAEIQQLQARAGEMAIKPDSDN